MTFDEMLFHNTTPMFANGQLYVALSRVRSIEGLQMMKKIPYKDVKVSHTAKKYYKKFLADN